MKRGMGGMTCAPNTGGCTTCLHANGLDTLSGAGSQIQTMRNVISRMMPEAHP